MIEDANLLIWRANLEAIRRREAAVYGRRPIRLLDRWLGEVETLVALNNPVVPEPLFAEIAGFLGRFDLRLYHRLQSSRRRKASRVLDVLFEAEELFLPKVAETA
jgi:hypothetical protein